MDQSLRAFVSSYSEVHPDEFVRVDETIDRVHQLQAVQLELERLGRFPILLFEDVKDSTIPVVCNVMASRRGYAHAFDVPLEDMAEEYARRLTDYIPPQRIEDPPFLHNVWEGDKADLHQLPIPTYYPGDPSPYITAGLTVANHPETGVSTQGYHRYQVKGPRKMGVSLHSRRRMFEYHRIAEQKGAALPCALALGLHPFVGLASLSYPPPAVSKAEVVGGLFGAPMQIARTPVLGVDVPAWAEIVIEGEILAQAREDEGPFGEFTGYFSRRSTQNVFRVRSICLRDDAWYQSIGSGRLADHILPLGVLREVEVKKAVSRAVPHVVDVHVPVSGGGSFTAYVSIKQTRPGEAKQIIPIVLGVDHYIKFVVIVDEDVDVRNESDVLWAMATRMQADRDLVVVPGSLGAMLDPSATSQGLTDKLGIDATRPHGEPFGESLQMDTAVQDWARMFVSKAVR